MFVKLTRSRGVTTITDTCFNTVYRDELCSCSVPHCKYTAYTIYKVYKNRQLNVLRNLGAFYAWLQTSEHFNRGIIFKYAQSAVMSVPLSLRHDITLSAPHLKIINNYIKEF